MGTSQAYIDFQGALSLAQSLIDIEATYPQSPPLHQQKAVEALRGGASVLMVAAFENYLKELVEERLDVLTRTPPCFKFEHLPYDMQYSDWEYLVKEATKIKKEDRVDAYRDMVNKMISGVVHTSSFSEAARSNPNPKKVEDLFRRLGVQDFFVKIKPEFDAKWSPPYTPRTFINDTLTIIIERRHIAAHTAKALSITNNDLRNALQFLTVLGSVCDQFLENHVQQIISNSP